MAAVVLALALPAALALDRHEAEVARVESEQLTATVRHHMATNIADAARAAVTRGRTSNRALEERIAAQRDRIAELRARIAELGG